MIKSPHYYLGLCAIARDETPFLREWVAYHYYIGFEKIYIYDNQSAVPVRDVVAEFYDIGVCDTYTLPGEAMQNIAYNLCLDRHGHEFEWLAFFDLDEFLCLKQDTDARVLLRDYEDYSGLILQWDMFSSSGHITRPDGMVTLNYTQSLGYSNNSKCIVRPDKVKMTITSHHFMFHDGFAVNTSREPALRAYTPMAVDKVCLNHYSYRSQQDFAGKMEKADATYGLENPRRWEGFYRQASQPVVERDDITPVALEVQPVLEHGVFSQRYGVIMAMLEAMEFPKIISYMAKMLSLHQDGLAEVVFALSYKRFSANWEFVRLGVSLCIKLKKYERAMLLVNAWMASSPDENGYLALAECYLAEGKKDAATRICHYLLQVARSMDNHALREKTTALARQYAVELGW